MTVIKSFSVGSGDMFYISHRTDNFTIIDCNLTGDRDDEIIAELKVEARRKSLRRFISTHPDQDHFAGIHKLDDNLPISNFYVVGNDALKGGETEAFKHYCRLRDDPKKAFYLHAGCRRKWMNRGDDDRPGAGLSVLWPDTSNPEFLTALANCEAGLSCNNTSAVVRYALNGGASVLWLGDLETAYMEAIADDIELPKTTVVFAAHHGRKSGKIPDSWLEKLDPQIIIIGEARTRELDYYTGYEKITQNRAGDITMHLERDKVHFYTSNPAFEKPQWDDEMQTKFENYIGSVTVEIEYTL